MNTLYKTCILLLISMLFVSCSDGFEEINTNPNAPIEVQPELLFRQVIYDYGEQMSYEGFVAGNLLSQHFAMVDFNLFDRHDLSSPQLGGNPWPIIYRNLRDNELVLEATGKSPVYEVYEGPALILKAYMAAALTDIYGDVPYFNALNGKQGHITPAYDAQEDIYLASGGILDNLEKAVVAIKNYSGSQTLKGDLLYNGRLQAWINLANSLRIKYLMRISDRVDVAPALQAIVNEGEYIQNNADNATFDFTNSQPNTFRMAVLRSGDFNLFVQSETLEEVLENLNDSRQRVFFRPSEATGNYEGLRNGPDASNTSISVANYSLTGTIFRENTEGLDANFMTAWETYFLLAEAAEKGLISQNAQAYYEMGVQLAFQYWQSEMPSTYLTTGNAAYGANRANPLEQIITQKWIANTINGYEGWIEFRRTGFPQLKNVAASLNNGLIPVRMPYPADEAALNAVNYQAATANNENSVNSKVWWDAN